MRFDYGIGISDMPCIEGCALDIGNRLGAMADRYLVEYANIGIPKAIATHILNRISTASLFARDRKSVV